MSEIGMSGERAKVECVCLLNYYVSMDIPQEFSVGKGYWRANHEAGWA